MSTPSDHRDHRPDGGTPPDRRRRAVVVAGHAGDPATARAAADDDDAGVRAAALGALERLGELDAATLAAGLADPDPRVRSRAALAAGRRRDLGAELARLLDDEDHAVAEVAAFACGERPGAEVGLVGRLSAMAVGHPDHLCREAAVAALGSLGDPEGLPAVLHGCGDRHTVRRRAVLALAAFDGPEVTAMLERLVGDRDLQVRQAAEELLAIEQGSTVGPPEDPSPSEDPPGDGDGSARR